MSDNPANFDTWSESSNREAAEFIFGILDNAAMDVIANQVVALAATIRNTANVAFDTTGQTYGREAADIWIACFQYAQEIREQQQPGDNVVALELENDDE